MSLQPPISGPMTPTPAVEVVATPAPEKPPATASIHGDFLEAAMPPWLTEATAPRKKAIKDAATVLPGWYLQASPAQRAVVDASYKASLTAQTQLDKTLSTFMGVDDFARPLLLKALKDQYNTVVDVDKVQLCLRRPLELGVLAIEVASFEFLKLPLLQAALHNFESWECKPGAYHKTSGFVEETATAGLYAPVAVTLTVSEFLSLCRSLDIGAQYQTYLRAFFHPADGGVEATLKHHFIASQKAAMTAAAEQALLTGHIRADDHAMILSVINGENHPWMGKKQVWFQDMGLMKQRMVGCVAFVICEKYRYNDELILYIPNDPAHPLKRYNSEQMKAEFKRLFTERGDAPGDSAAPSDYQRFFSQFVPYDKRSYYFSQFTRKSADSPTDYLHSPWRTLAEFLNPVSSLTYIRELPPEQPGKMEPVADPYIRASNVTRKGRGIWADNADLWTYLYETHRDKVIADARSHAVSSDDVDVKAREAKLAHLLQAGLLGVNLISMFVPVLGEVMMVVMAGQLLYETLEGAIEWSEGDKRAAKAHLVDVAENLALIGVMAGVGAGVGKLTAVKPEPVIEPLAQVTLPNGETRLWKPDLSAYESSVSLDAGAMPNAQGQHVIDGKTYVRQGTRLYEKFYDPAIGKWRIKHPTDAHAYQPILESNGLGAWRHTLEQPSTWDRLTLLRRIGHQTEGFTDETLLKIADVSGVSDNALRKMHLDNAAAPPELRDAMRLFQADSAAGQVIGQLQGTTPIDAHYLQALSLMPEMPRWPTGRALEIFSGPQLSGESVSYGAAHRVPGLARRPSIKITQAAVLKGQLPTTVMAALDEPEITHLLGGEGARVGADRPNEFARQFADYAQTRQPQLFERLYQQGAAGGARTRYLQRECPGLSDAAAEQVLAQASAEDLARLDATHRSPLNILEEARWYAAQGRQVRAYAGLRSENLASADSRRLALRALEQLPGWPDTLRLEVREGSASGTLLESIGSASAPEQKILVKNGPRYQAFNDRAEALNSVPRTGDNFYPSIMHALPDNTRAALGVPHVSQSSELQASIIKAADLHRSEAARWLEPQVRWLKPPVRVSENMFGYLASGRGGSFNPSLITRAEQLYPNPFQAQAFLRQQAGLTDRQIFGVLQNRTREWETLNATLEQWAGAPGSAAHQHKVQVMQALKACWRNAPMSVETPSAARLSIICDEPLPLLATDFSHVRELTVRGRGMTDASADAFLARFPGVRQLSIGARGNPFGTLGSRMQPLTGLPRTVSEMPGLTHLSFTSESLSLAADFPQQLRALTSLQSLHINYNGFDWNVLDSMDLAPLKQLRELRIDAPYALRQWPTFVQGLEQLERLDLSKTAIGQIPEALYTGHEKLWAGLSIDWSNFSREAFKPAFEYVQGYSGQFGHLLDVHQMVKDYARGELAFLTSEPSLNSTLADKILNSADTPEARLAVIDALGEEHASIFRSFYGPTQSAGLRQAQRTINSVTGNNAGVFHALEKCWRGGVRQRYGLAAEASTFELPDAIFRMSDVMRSEKIKQLPTLPAGSLAHVQTLRLGWLDLPNEQLRGFMQAFSGTRTLEISDNGLTEWPVASGDLPALTQLDMHHNNIVVTPAIQAHIDGLSTLHFLNLANNPLATLDVSALTQLKALNLRGTRLQAWPSGAENLPDLAWLDLRDNALESLSAQALADDRALMNAHLSGNPLTAQARTNVAAARQRIEIARGLPAGALERFASEPVPEDFPPQETVQAIASQLLPLLEPATYPQGPAGFTQRLQHLDPLMFPEQARLKLEQLRSDGMTDLQIDAQINQWQQDFETLTRQLNGWLFIREVRSTRSIVSAETRSLAALRIRELWQEGLSNRGRTAERTLSLNDLRTGDLPALAVQFSEVATLDLTGVGLTAQGSDSFLTSFPQLKRLTLDNNSLETLPEAVLHMAHLERLDLDANLFANPQSLYRHAGGARLRSLDLGHNLLTSFDCAPFSRLHTLELNYNPILLWPYGALDAQHLRALNLSGSSIAELPDTLFEPGHDDLVAGTDLSENRELSLRTLERLRDYSDDHLGAGVMQISREEIDARLEESSSDSEGESDGSGSGGSSDSDPDDDSDGHGRPDAGAFVQPSEAIFDPALDTADAALDPWLANTRTEVAKVRRGLWLQLAQEANHERFFNLLTLLRSTDEFRLARADLTRRLWEVMQAAAENAELRELLFHNAETHGTCIDGRILTFSELEVRVFVYHALRNIGPGRPLLRGQALLRLSRQLFRLDRVETIAEAAATRRDRAEVRLRYRIGLTSGWGDGIDLPGQPAHMAFDTPITGRLLADTRASILAAEHTDALLESLVARDYWSTYLEERYPEEIAAINLALAEERPQLLSDLEDRRANGEIDDQTYENEVVGIAKKIEAKRKQKLLELSRKELILLSAEPSPTRPSSPQPGPSHRP